MQWSIRNGEGNMKTKLLAGLGIAALLPLTSFAAVEAVPGEFVVRMKPGLHALMAPKLPVGVHVRESLSADKILVKAGSLAAAAQIPGAALAEPNYIYRAQKRAFDWSLENLGQADCRGGQGPAGIDVRAVPAWKISTGEGVTVAVLDTGVDVENPRLASRIDINEAEASGQPGVDDDGNGYVDDVKGYDFVSERGIGDDDHGHGTFCAGMIATAGAEEDILQGLAPGAKILPVKFLTRDGAGTLADAVRAFDYALARGAKVISASWGGGERSQLLEEAVIRANAQGVLVVAAAGNDGSSFDSAPAFPAAYKLPNVIAVAAINRGGNLTYFSNFSPSSVHIAAPGENLLGLVIGGRAECMSGTSMATPQVAAAAALILAKSPGLSPAAVKAKLMQTATRLPSLEGKVASGLLNVFEAVKGL